METYEAVQRLKSEVLAQDWSLSGRRIDLLTEALAALRGEFESRRGMTYILRMSEGTLDYIGRRGRDFYPAALDFLKETLAHLITALEDEDFSRVSEARLFHGAYTRFNELKKNVRIEDVRAKAGRAGKRRLRAP